MKVQHTTLYRDKQNAKLMGVCAGIADYTGIDTIWVRLGAVGLTFLTGGWIIPLYIVAGFVLGDKPKHLYEDKSEQKYWQRVRRVSGVSTCVGGSLSWRGLYCSFSGQ